VVHQCRTIILLIEHPSLGVSIHSIKHPINILLKAPILYVRLLHNPADLLEHPPLMLLPPSQPAHLPEPRLDTLGHLLGMSDFSSDRPDKQHTYRFVLASDGCEVDVHGVLGVFVFVDPVLAVEGEFF
jgi:hypothetical protein